jgi:very-short-patch-repair endonuclease
MTKLFNRGNERFRRKILRKNMPRAEVILWSKIRGKGLGGYKFRRQHSVGKFVMDFYCPKLKLAIEVDGDSHFIEGAKERDRERQTIMEAVGITFLRFNNREIYENINGVLNKIMECMKTKNSLTSPLSSPY